MLRKSLLTKIFNASCMQRWNDKLRPIELTEIDKQAHKMMITYFLAKYEDDAEINWNHIINGGIYEFLLRAVLTDIKPPIYYKIKEKTADYYELKKWAYDQWELMIRDFETNKDHTPLFHTSFIDYFSSDDETKEKEILSAAHQIASLSEYGIIKQFKGPDYEFKIEDNLIEKVKHYNHLKGVQLFLQEKENKQVESKESIQKKRLTYLIDMCGQLRYQLRWAHIHRSPKTSVLGHLFFVAIISYLLSFDIDPEVDKEQLQYNFFTGLFHDLPEVLTRDIVSPVKRSISGLDKIIKRLETAEMNSKIIQYLPQSCKKEMRIYTGIFTDSKTRNQVGEFNNLYKMKNAIYSKKTDDPGEKKLRDGEIVKAADDLAAFIEAFVAIENGCSSRVLYDALNTIRPPTCQKKENKFYSEEIFQKVEPIYADFY